MDCARCGSANPEGDRFCGECGAPLPQRCRACGHENPTGKNFCGGCGVHLARNNAPEQGPSLAARVTLATPSAERRQVTVVFCDLVGSTALSTQLDPEDLREVIGTYHRCVAEIAGRFAGFIAKYMGDGVLLYFGYPSAHEDDPERAIRAGLDLVAAVRALRPRAVADLHCRVGIATGLVVVGDLVGTGEAQERGIVGETPNLAARLQTLAEPNAVLIAHGTRRLVGDLFEYRDLGAVAVKGIGEPMQAWQVLHESRVESRFEAFHASALTPLVGREEEIELLLRRWAQAKDGEGRAILLVGEPGIGKSRITRAVKDCLAGERHARLLYCCSPRHQASSLRPFISQLEHAAAFERDDLPGRKLDKLEALITRLSKDPAHDAALMAVLMSIPSDNRYAPRDLTPQRRKEETLASLLAQLEGLAARQPVLMIFEDAHWIDPTSLELLERIVERVQRLPVLLVVTARPEFTPPWAGRPHITVHPLNRLGRREGLTMIGRVAGGRTLPSEVVDQIMARTDGVPLFLEELTKALLESGVLHVEGERYALAAPLPSLAIPTTLQASLMARLDRLGPARTIAEVGAAIGREFSHELMAAVSEAAEKDLNDALQQLVASELLYRRGVPPDAIYIFKHALVQDAAYSTLLRGARQGLHARIATVLAERFPEVATTQPELLAHHCAEGGMIETAIDYWFAAGKRALRTSANIEAIKHLTQGVQLLTSSLPDTPESQRKELQFQTALGPAYLAIRGQASREAAEAYSRAEDLCRRLGDLGERFKVVSGLWVIHQTRGDDRRAGELSDELFRLAEQLDDDDLRLQALHSRWARDTWIGEFARAREHAERGLILYSPTKHGTHALTYVGHDPGVCGVAHSAIDLWFLGYPDRAAEEVGRSVALAGQIGHPPTVALALQYATLCGQLRRDEAMVRMWGEQLASVAAEQRLALQEATANFARGWVLANQGQANGSLSELRQGLDGCLNLGMRLFEPYQQALLAEVHLNAGEAAVGLEIVEEARRFVDASGLCFWDAELLRLKGKLLANLSPDREQEAEECYLSALAVARRQQARSLELRAATNLARLWRDRGERSEALDLLSPIHAWFTEGSDTRDLTEARVLLDELG